MSAVEAICAPPDWSRARYPVVWSDQKRNALLAVAKGELPARSPLDVELALPLIKCADGRFSEAEDLIIRILEENKERIRSNGEAFVSALHALFVVQRLDLAAIALRDRYGFTGDLRIAIESPGPGVSKVRWEIDPDRKHLFVFDADLLRDDEQSRLEVLAFQWEFPLFSHYSSISEPETGAIMINKADIGSTPGIAYCDSRPEYFLVPDCIFVPSRGYEYARQMYTDHYVAWEDRKPVALWRGATTGIPTGPDDWRSLERIKLCQLANSASPAGLFDVGISSVAQFRNPKVAEEVKASGLMRGFVAWQQWNQYKYQIDIDGNSSPWSNLFQRLLTGSPVLKVESARGLRQWYYDRLVPWENYVPVAPDMWDLVDKVKWLAKNGSEAKRIGEAGREFALGMLYESEMARAMDTVSAAFRYFRGRPGGE